MSHALAAADAHLVTADELFAMPDDSIRRELVRGEVREMSPAGKRHGKTGMRVALRLAAYVEAAGLGEVYGPDTGFRLFADPDTVRVPDVSFVTRAHAAEVGEIDGFIPGTPDLAIEVISPTDRYSEVDEKVSEYLEAGTRMVVVVNPRRRVATVYRSPRDIVLLTENDTLDGGDVVPGWSLPLRELFPQS